MKYILLYLAMFILSCNSNSSSSGSFRDIAVSDLARELKQYEDPIILDVRTPEEIAQGNVKGSMHLDYRNPNFETELKKLQKDKTYFVYCKSGGRSGKTIKKMEELGFSRAYNILGGYTAISNPGN